MFDRKNKKDVFVFFFSFQVCPRDESNSTDLHIKCKNLVVEKDQGSLYKNNKRNDQQMITTLCDYVGCLWQVRSHAYQTINTYYIIKHKQCF